MTVNFAPEGTHKWQQAALRCREVVRRWMRYAGVELSRFPAPTSALHRRGALLRHYGVDLVLDVGANEGQFGLELRRDLGYRGRIVSFEPLDTAFARLKLRAAEAQPWDLRQIALGNRCGTAILQVAGNSESSSLLPMLQAHLNAAPLAAYVAQRTVEVATLDSLCPQFQMQGRQVWLKIDAQGSEAQVLDGASASLAAIDTVQLELSLLPLYDGAPTFVALHDRMEREGFRLIGVEPGFQDNGSGELLQMDGIYHRVERYKIGATL